MSSTYLAVSGIPDPDVKVPPEQVMTITIEIGRGEFAMEDAFKLRQHAIEVGNASSALWGKLSDPHKDVLTKIYQRALEVMHQHVERYLPNIITGAPGDLININTKILLSKIEEEVEIIEAASAFGKEATKRQLIAELIADVEPLEDDQFLAHVVESLSHGVTIPNDAVKRVLEITGVIKDEE